MIDIIIICIIMFVKLKSCLLFYSLIFLSLLQRKDYPPSAREQDAETESRRINR